MSRGRGGTTGDYRVGRTIGTGRISFVDEAGGEKSGGSKTGFWQWLGIILLATALVGGVVWLINYSRTTGDSTVVEVVPEPTVEWVDEAGRSEISSREKLLMVRLEQEAGDYGLSLSRIVFPAGMQRQVDVYISGRTEYYKVLTERSPAESMEDIARVGKYLDGLGLESESWPAYVDVRVVGKAYYK